MTKVNNMLEDNLKPEQIPYGVKDFKRVRQEHLYYVDKTAFIRKMEQRGDFLFFVRPRRFGKSLFCEMLRCYYDVAEQDNFSQLFGDLDIGAQPTSGANKYIVLALDFSQVNARLGKTWEEKFLAYMETRLDALISSHHELFKDDAQVMKYFLQPGGGDKFESIVLAAKRQGYGIYVIVDEYDNFTNEIVSTAGERPYKEITHGTGFYRGWFKLFKGLCDRIFMTGVSPVTMDDLTSGFNIATNISMNGEFHAMAGFTSEETQRLFNDFCGCGKYLSDAESHLATVKAWYDSYCFSEDKVGVESLYM